MMRPQIITLRTGASLRIVPTPTTHTLTLHEAQALNKPFKIFAAVYLRRVAVLTDYQEKTQGNERAAFYQGGTAYHTASITKQRVMERTLQSGGEVKLYIFDDWADFARAVVDNGWNSGF